MSKKAWIFFSVFALLHLGSVVFVRLTRADVSPIQDALEYKMLGTNLLAGNGFSVATTPPFAPNLLRPPAYPFFLAITYWFDRSGLLAITLQQIFLLLAGLILFKIFIFYKKEVIGYWFTALFLLEPLQWMLSLQTMSETFFTFLAALSLYLIIIKKSSASNKSRLIADSLAGLALGVGILARPSGTLWLPGLVLGIITLTAGAWRRKLIAAGIFILTLSAIIAPWVARNYILTGRPLLSSSYEYNIIIGFGTDAEIAAIQSGPNIYDAKGRRGYNLAGEEAGFYPHLKIMADTVIKRVGKTKIITAQLLGMPKIWFNSRYDTILDMARKGLGNSRAGKIIAVADDVFWSLILILVILGVWHLAATPEWPLGLMTALILIFNAAVTLTISYTRMRAPLLPVIFLLAGFGIYKLFFFVNKIRRANGA